MTLPARLRRRRQARSRRRLARAIRKQARDERERRVGAGDVDITSLAGRTSLYDEIAAQLEDPELPLSAALTARIRSLLAEPVPLLDFGPYSRARDAEIAAVLADLSEGRGR